MRQFSLFRIPDNASIVNDMIYEKTPFRGNQSRLTLSRRSGSLPTMTTKRTTRLNFYPQLAIFLTACFGSTLVVGAPTNSVTGGDNINYTINGQPDPPFTFQRGVTYVFLLSNLNGFPTHPFWIKSSLGLGSAGAFSSGVLNNGANSGSVTFTVPAAAPSQLFYQCGNHGAMSGVLTIVDPPTPPTVKIVFINVADFVTLKSTGTNGWDAFPEFRCGFDNPNWTAVATFTNNLVNGTNTTTFPRLESVCGSTNVLLRVRNQPLPP